MYRATTPRHVFYFKGVDPAGFKTILITYAQMGQIVLEKTKTDLTFEAPSEGVYKAHLRLTQEEANLFKNGNVNIQVRAVTGTGDALASEIKNLKVQEVLNDEVLE